MMPVCEDYVLCVGIIHKHEPFPCLYVSVTGFHFTGDVWISSHHLKVAVGVLSVSEYIFKTE